jgi:hypothetical protein
MTDAFISGVEDDEAQGVTDRMLVVAALLMERNRVWKAVIELGKQLQGVRRMDGSTAFGIILRAMRTRDTAGIFANAVEQAHTLERQIHATEIVIAKSPDGSRTVVKGQALVNQIGQQFMEIRLVHRVFGESLWRAFGDGALQERPGIESAKAGAS